MSPNVVAREVTLGPLFAGRPCRIVGDADLVIRDLAYDSRAVTRGTLFFAVAGEHHDGHDFVSTAVERGAIAAVTSREVQTAGLGAQVIVEDVRRAMGPVAHRFFGDPTASLALAGVTGTNGKTTTAHMLHHILSYRGSVGLLGTVEYRIAGEVIRASRTTPEAIDLARAFASMVEAGAWAAAMEVSSHALDQGRTDGCRFEAVGFTNLSQDHLDYHHTMEEYFGAKKRLFADGRPTRAVNADDAFGARLIADGLFDVSFGSGDDVTLRARAVSAGADGTTMVFDGMGLESAEVRVPVVGAHNVANAACAVALSRALEVPAEVVADRLAGVPQVPGRLERIDAGQPFAVFVDYAHTPDGLAQVIPALRSVTTGRVLTVFGCGGDRDRAKRPLMGEIAARESDALFVTSDNPRSEEPAAILADILEGVRRVEAADAVVEPDRRAAIEAAFAAARPGDAVLIAGKGHETGQQIGAEVIPFDDRVVARELLAGLGRAR